MYVKYAGSDFTRECISSVIKRDKKFGLSQAETVVYLLYIMRIFGRP